MSNVTPLFAQSGKRPAQVTFNRIELGLILDLYGRCVAAGLFRDYALTMERTIAVFAAFERTAERPQYEIIKEPDLARKQGEYALKGANGAVLKRGHDLRSVLAPLERKLVKTVEE
jgi:Protein of unknown function (DUF2794)